MFKCQYMSLATYHFPQAQMRHPAHTNREPDLGFFARPIQNETTGPSYTFIGTKKSHRKNLEKMDLRIAALTVRGGTWSSWTVRNQHFWQGFETKYVQW